ncbi:hypothetical protein F2P56_003170 [Juglans regia]|uniref:Uncharacterized protein n=2 Tax=Juglans regia TaxID=51240 RepID=A0A833YGB8_JUGRE|nr:uncharacterized protein LOC108982077 [Juglans regia]KAF5482614.1 hypothetical protein F2P56_003170 [Juglans regia]
MGHFRHPYIQAANMFSHFCNSNKTIRFLLSFSLLSIILSHSSLLPFLLDSFHIHVSTFPLKPFSYTIDKNYVFLFCNGLLVFIVKNSGLVGNNSSLGDDLDEECVMKNGDSTRPSEQELGLSENKASDGSKNALPEVEEEEERANGTLIALGEGENGLILAMHDEDEEQDNGLVIIKEEEEEEEGNGLELLSTEELNKIFDDFIRKKKEEIKFGGQQLIVV